MTSTTTPPAVQRPLTGTAAVKAVRKAFSSSIASVLAVAISDTAHSSFGALRAGVIRPLAVPSVGSGRTRLYRSRSAVSWTHGDRRRAADVARA